MSDRGSFNYHDNRIWQAPEPLRIERVEPHDVVTDPYYRVGFGCDLTIFMSRERLLELAGLIFALFNEPSPPVYVENTSGYSDADQISPGSHLDDNGNESTPVASEATA